jgi:hypothetical protein
MHDSRFLSPFEMTGAASVQQISLSIRNDRRCEDSAFNSILP